MNFFCDRCFPVRLTEVLRVIEGGAHSFEHHDAHFGQETDDTQWLPVVGKWNPKPIILSGDARILSRRDEIAALMEQNLYFVTMYSGWTEQSIYDQTWKLIKVWPLILKTLARCKAPTVFKVVPAANNLENLGLTKGFRK